MNWNYDEFAEKLAIGRIDVDGAEIPLVLEEDKARYCCRLSAACLRRAPYRLGL